jgi:RNA polymerase sigma factor (sigma-70 family)
MDRTTHFVQRAITGDPESIGWLIERFSPLLLSQAGYRLARHLRELYDPEDLVNDVWGITLPRLADIQPRGGRHTPVLVKYLTRTLLLRYNTLIKKHLQGKPLRLAADGDGVDPLDALPAEVTGVVTRMVRKETVGTLLTCIEQLRPKYREVLILRGIEQSTNREVAAALGLEPNAVAVRFKRAKELLRESLPSELGEFLAEFT